MIKDRVIPEPDEILPGPAGVDQLTSHLSRWDVKRPGALKSFGDVWRVDEADELKFELNFERRRYRE